MATKLQFYGAVAERTVKELTHRRGNWMHFLETAARLYKYPFPDQMMIFAQRPDAIACAPLELWNDSFDRWVRRGSKGIALIDDTGSYPRLKYVFDVADTEPSRYNARPVKLWEMRQEHRESVLAELAKSYDDVGDTLSESFHNIALQLATEYYDDNARDIHYRAEDSFLEARTVYDFAGSPIEDADDGTLKAAFVDALSKSIAYSLMSRCGFDTSEHFDDEDFGVITEFNTPDMVYALGTATSELSAQVLRDIEIVIKKYERTHTAERSEQNYDRNPYLQPSRRLSDTRSGVERAGANGAERGGTRPSGAGEIREDAESLSERTQDNQLQPSAADREIISPPPGSGTGGDGAARTDDESADGADGVARQGGRPDGLDGGDEHLARPSGGNGSPRIDLQLEEQAGAAEEAAPFSMAELAQYHTDWNEYVINGVLNDEAVLNAALNSDRQNTETEIANSLKRLQSAIHRQILDSTEVKKGALWNELDDYFTKERKPPLAEQLYDTVIRSDTYAARTAASATTVGQENPVVSADSSAAKPALHTFSQVGKSSILDILSTSPITLDEVDAILRDGGNLDDHRLNVTPFHSRSVLRIAARFAKGLDDNAAFLKQEYLTGRYGRRFTESGKGFDFGNHRAGVRFQVSAWFTVEGIEFATGTTAQKNARKMLIPWEDAAARIDELMREGRYITRSAFDNSLDNERRELADKLWDFYRDDMHHIPEEWNSHKGNPDDVAIITSLLENDAERQAIRDRLEADVTAWLNDPESRSWHNPRRLLEEMNALMHLPVIHQTADEVDTKAFTYFITQDEIDSLLTHGGSYSEGKMRFLSFFLHDHDTKEKIEFVKREYGHGGGTWGQTNGWHNAEPGKGVNLKRGTLGSPEAVVNLKWPAVIKRTEQLIGSGQYMTREELDNIPSYERLMLARKLNSFFYTLPEEYERPFPGKSSGIYPNEYRDENGEKTLDFHYPREAEWQAIRDLLDYPERVESLLARMQYIFDNTPEEDRHYDYKKAGIEALTSYHNGTYTLFPGLDNLPEPGTVQPRRHSESVIDLNERGFGEIPQASEQMTLFGIMEPQLPSVNEQIAKIDQSLQQEAADADAPFLSISEADKARIAAQFSQNPRSREAANLVREVYGDSLGMPLPQAIKRITDLVENGAFSIQHDPYTLFDRVRDELSERGFAVSGELIEDALNEYNAVGGKGDFQDIADFIENEYLTEEEPEYEPVNLESPDDKQSEAPTAPISEPSAAEPAELDFDTVAQTVLERVMADTEFAAAISTAQSRGALRSICGVVLERSIREHLTDEPQVFDRFLNDDDFNEDIYNYVLRQSWERRPQAQAVIASEAETPKPAVEKLFSADRTDYYLFYYPVKTETPAALSYDTLPLVNDQADKYVICSDVCYLSDSDLMQYGIVFRKMPRDWNLLPEAVQDKIRAIRPDYEQQWLELTRHERDFAEWQETQQAPNAPPPVQTSPPPVFFVDWEKAQHDFDLNLYQDHDVIGYNKDGVKTELGRSGNFTYITTTGAFWGSNEVPGDIYEQIQAYKNGDVTDEQVRENYLKILEDFKKQRTTAVDSAQEPPRFTEKPIENVADVLGSHPAFDRISENDKPYGVWDRVSEDWVRDFDGHISFNSEMGAGADAEQLNAEHPEAPAPELPVADTRHTSPPSPHLIPAAANFRITDDHLGEGGAKTKFRYNIEAIKTLQAIEFEKRVATPEEQQTLSRYVGWGGIQQAFDPNNKQWENEYLELNMLLSPEEWESARASVLNAHYTSPTVIKAIYEAVERMGFKSGNVLEPACGVGNFFGLLPDSMKAAKLYGVELDSVTARIAKQLYPKADIKETGFEKTDMPDSFFDLAIGNVPFGDYGIADKRYDKHHFKVHDYFFGKTLDQVRPGGVIAFITSKGTLDKKNPEVRKYIAQRAELLGAVRLPNTAFLKNAGTEVTSDIIFLKKRDRPLDIEPDWVHLGMTEDGIPVNRYFADNPEMILGRMTNDSGTRMYGNENSTTCEPFEGADLAEQLKTVLSYIQGEFTAPELDDIDGVDNHAIPADSNVKNFSYALITPATEPDNADGQIYAAKIGEGQVYFRENSLMYPVDLPVTTLERIKGMIALRDCVHRLIQLQLDDHDEAEISAQQQELNDLYDSFIAEFGLINSTANNRAFNADSAYYLLSSLEILDEEGNLARKADMFTKRTIKQKTVITHVDTASEALAVSLSERARVDLDYMSALTGFSVDRLISDLQGVIFCDIGNPNRSLPNFDPDKMKIYEKYPFVTAGEYLSGNVREKLAKAKQFQEVCGDSFHGIDVVGNVTALEAVMPKDLDASEIAVRLGSTWIDPEYVQQFMYELLNTTNRNQQLYRVNYFPYTGLWQVSGKGRAQYSDVSATATYGTTRMNAYEIIDDTLNLRDVRVYDYKEDADGRQVRVLNKKETMLAQQRQDLIKQAFKDWIWKDPERRQTLVQLYNERFNSVRPREYDGSHIQFVGANPEITFLKHQEDAVARQMYGGNTLLAHVVGAGKTFEMVAAAMEMKRLGLCQKSLFAVPNHLTEQWAAEFLRLYPNANILVAKKKDFEMRNRKKFCAKIATGEYDAIIIGHTQMEKIPMSRERQERLLNNQLYEIEQGIAELKESNGEKFTIKQLEKTKKSIETRLVKLLEAKQRDDVVTFEQLGVDRLFVDEAHGFKNLFLYTKMRNVAGLSTSEAQKSSDLFMKCRYMDELTGNKGVIFATGTPISNSMTEMYTMQRYLQYDKLAAKNLIHFDSWASIFGETVTSIELAPEGTGYRARTRFAQFHNLPELMCMFKEVADIQTADMLNLPVPDAKYETIVVEPSEFQKEMVQELSERAAAVHAKLVDPRDDNMLKITTDGRKIGLDQRLYNPLLSDFEGSKVNACTENVFSIWNDTRADRLTQLVFCDFSTPNKDGRFNIYDDIKAKLIERGIPEHEIAFIHDADTETRKKELFAKVRQGKVRVLFGSTFKMGAGTNVQDKLIAIHDADCPWRPADLEQRAGRIVRQGNQNAEVKIFRYATNGTFVVS